MRSRDCERHGPGAAGRPRDEGPPGGRSEGRAGMSGTGRPEDGTVDASGLTIGIVATRWHGEITDRLLERAVLAAQACGIPTPVVARVAGALELSVVAQQLARENDAVVCLGAVIRGETAH